MSKTNTASSLSSRVSCTEIDSGTWLAPRLVGGRSIRIAPAEGVCRASIIYSGGVALCQRN